MSKKNKTNIPQDKWDQCNVIIHGASAAVSGVAAGIAQIPLADNMVITPIQIGMIVSLGTVFEQEISESAAKGILGGMMAAFVGRGVAQALTWWLPFIGNFVNAATAVSITEALGWKAAEDFSKKYEKTKKEESFKAKENEKRNEEESRISKDLEKRAEEFFKGNKNRKDNKEEFNDLLHDVEEYDFSLPKNEWLKKLYDKLHSL